MHRVSGLFPGGKTAWVCTQLHLALELRMGGAVPHLFLYAFLALTGITLPVPHVRWLLPFPVAYTSKLPPYLLLGRNGSLMPV